MGYTLYDTPHKRVEHALSQRQKQDNFDYFIRVRLSRLKFFQAWLHDNFKINASLDGSGIVALDAWIGSYGGGLIGDEPHTMRIFETYHPLWVGEYAGYNVMVDIAIFLGEYLILRRPRLHWEMLQRLLDSEGDMGDSELGLPIIGGFHELLQWKADVFYDAYSGIAGSRQRSKSIYDPVIHGNNSLIDQIKTILHVANLSDEEARTFIMGSFRNEQL